MRRRVARPLRPLTSLEPAPPGLAPGREVWLKREDVHELGAFKWRGALPTLESYRAAGATEVVTASTGNHGAATAWAAARLGLSAAVYVPVGASAAKTALIEAQGAELRRMGADLDEAKELGQAYAAERGLPFFEDGAEPAQVAGYRAIGEEILAQASVPPASVVVPVGNGALIAGVGEGLGGLTEVVAVAAQEAPVMALSYHLGRAAECDRSATFADGLAVRVAIPSAVQLVSRVADRFLLVSERELAEATAAYFRAGIRAEGAAAAALAALPRLDPDGPVVLVVTGRNIDETLLRRTLVDPASFSD